MRPLKLIIEGFCSYANRTEIDLSKFGTSGLYLITGNTGSGKTTIFDAIAFALFGEPSGNNRQTSMLRSSFATVDQLTQVELTFTLGDAVYTIKRNPSYERRAKRGEGTTVEPANVILTMPDGKLLEGPKTVDKKITELLGIDREQFCQIVMLAQGDFQRLLTEDTNTRLAIFRKLFKTDNYQLIQKKLTEKRGELGKIVSDLSKSLNQFFAGTMCDQDNVLTLELEKAKTQEISWEEKIILLEKIIACDAEEKQKLEELQKENQKKLDEINVALSAAASVEKAKIELSRKNEETLQLKTVLENLKNSVEEAKLVYNQNGEKEQKVAVIKQDLQKYDDLELKSKELSSFEQFEQTIRKKILHAEQEINQLEEKKTGIEAEISSLNSDEDKRTNLTVEQKNLEEAVEALKKLDRDLEEQKKCLTRLTQAQKEYVEASGKSSACERKYLEENQAFLDGQAGILAQQLKPECPCPVCGSLEHPHPSQKTLFVPTQEELNQLKEEKDLLSAQTSKKSELAAGIKAEYETKLSVLNTAVASLIGENQTVSEQNGFEELKQVLADKIKTAEEKNKTVKNELEEELVRSERKQKLTASLPELTEKKEKLTGELNQYSVEKAQNETKISQLKKAVEETKKLLQFETKTDAGNEILKLEKLIAKAKADYEELQTKFADSDKKMAELKAQTKALQKQIEESAVVDVNQLKEDFEKYSETGSKLTQKNQQIFARIQTNTSALEHIKKDSEVLIQKQNLYIKLNELANTVSGNIGQGKAKIQLETYVQMHYFDRIIAHANKRFLIMSDGQYELTRKKYADNSQSQSGLELNVVDHYKGIQRDVKTLSGGESFEASLSLALGLSDEIAENAGGIRIDTMFVDEGFGTLDSDTLQKAYNALVSITEGNRLVGIISHVDYLKEKIDRQLVVKKEPDCGSFVTIKV